MNIICLWIKKLVYKEETLWKVIGQVVYHGFMDEPAWYAGYSRAAKATVNERQRRFQGVEVWFQFAKPPENCKDTSLIRRFNKK